MSEFLHFSEHTLQEVALLFMACVYILRIIWFLRFKAGTERQGPTGSPETSPRKGFLYSWANIAMPWAMESTRTKIWLYVQFVIFHVGVTVAIALSFVIPYGPGLLENVLSEFLLASLGQRCERAVLAKKRFHHARFQLAQAAAFSHELVTQVRQEGFVHQFYADGSGLERRNVAQPLRFPCGLSGKRVRLSEKSCRPRQPLR